MPPVAYTYAIPYEYYKNDKVRRYGFHGTSHKYVASRAADMLGKPIESLKLISCHLGNGSSEMCIRDRSSPAGVQRRFLQLTAAKAGQKGGRTPCGSRFPIILPTKSFCASRCPASS